MTTTAKKATTPKQKLEALAAEMGVVLVIDADAKAVRLFAPASKLFSQSDRQTEEVTAAKMADAYKDAIAFLKNGLYATELAPAEPEPALDGTEGQDRESYTDTQDRESYTDTQDRDDYTVDPELDEVEAQEPAPVEPVIDVHADVADERTVEELYEGADPIVFLPEPEPEPEQPTPAPEPTPTPELTLSPAAERAAAYVNFIHERLADAGIVGRVDYFSVQTDAATVAFTVDGDAVTAVLDRSAAVPEGWKRVLRYRETAGHLNTPLIVEKLQQAARVKAGGVE